jgi:Na+/alanine symporter
MKNKYKMMKTILHALFVATLIFLTTFATITVVFVYMNKSAKYFNPSEWNNDMKSLNLGVSAIIAFVTFVLEVQRDNHKK